VPRDTRGLRIWSRSRRRHVSRFDHSCWFPCSSVGSRDRQSSNVRSSPIRWQSLVETARPSEGQVDRPPAMDLALPAVAPRFVWSTVPWFSGIPFARAVGSRSRSPRIDREVRKLFRHMNGANLLLGAPRIHDELLKLGTEVSQSTVSTYTVGRSEIRSRPAEASDEIRLQHRADRCVRRCLSTAVAGRSCSSTLTDIPPNGSRTV
jgi:hypothetical protein